jgi:lysyl-tRNA synthetase class 2
MATEAEILAARRRRAEKLRDAGVELYPARVPYKPDRVPELIERFGETPGDELERQKQDATVAGRILGLRSFGKSAFVVLQAEGVRIQVWIKRDGVGEDVYAQFKSYEIGDFMWARGPLVRTKTDELTVEAGEIGFLAKSYRPLPEKWHGLVDVETRYRQRYVDLIVNSEARRITLTRSRATSAIRHFLEDRGFVEVETPVLQPLHGGALARPFTTHHHTYDRSLYLRISLELYLKRLIIGGIDRVYEIGRNFRNEGVDRTHNPEFSMLEVYQAYADYADMMELTENMVATVAERVLGTTVVVRDDREIDLAPPWPRRSMTELISDATGVDISKATDLESLQQAVRDAAVPKVSPGAAKTWGLLVDDLFSAAVEPTLIEPTLVVDYPTEISPLAKRHGEDPNIVERFEAFVCGIEIANAFSELNDPDDQRERFLAQQRDASMGDEEAHPIDEDFLRALEYGMPPTGGMGMGMGRLAMVLTGAAHLRETKLFPYMRPAEDD